MFDTVLASAKKAAKASNATYLDATLMAFKRRHDELPPGRSLDPISLAVWSEFETERKRRAAEHAAR